MCDFHVTVNQFKNCWQNHPNISRERSRLIAVIGLVSKYPSHKRKREALNLSLKPILEVSVTMAYKYIGCGD